MHRERIAASVFLVLSAAYTALAARIESAAQSPVMTLGPRGFPLLVGAAGIAVSLYLLFVDDRAARRAGTAAAGTTNGASGDATVAATAAPRPTSVLAGDWPRALALAGLTLLYALALPGLGFTLATTAFLAASFRLLGERRPWALLGVPLAIAATLLVLLRLALGAYLPEPLFETLLRRLLS